MGYNINQILAASEEAMKIREERLASFHNKKWDGFNIVVEKAVSKMKKLVKTDKELIHVAAQTA